MLKLEITVHECDKTGRHYLKFTPVFTPNVMAQGRLTFASHTAWLDEPEKHELTQQRALETARQVMSIFAKELAV
jgi:hypothetical protein